MGFAPTLTYGDDLSSEENEEMLNRGALPGPTQRHRQDQNRAQSERREDENADEKKHIQRLGTGEEKAITGSHKAEQDADRHRNPRRVLQRIFELQARCMSAAFVLPAAQPGMNHSGVIDFSRRFFSENLGPRGLEILGS